MVKDKTTTTGNAKRKNILSLLLLTAIILLLNFVGSALFQRFDLTSEKRYTLSESTRKLLKELDDEVFLKVYLQGDFNPGFTRLKNEAREILDEFRAYSGNQLQYEFIQPGEGLTKEETGNIERQLFEKGIQPEEVTDRKKDKLTKTLIWPGAIVSYKGRETAWQIFTRQEGISPEESINNSVEELEYSLTNAIRKLQRERKPEVTFIEGHDELDTVHLFRFQQALSEYYKVNRTPINGKLKALHGSDAIVIAKPNSEFSDQDKFIIDQYIMNGGKVLWLIDPLDVNMDSLAKGYTMGLNRPLGLERLLFKYGARVNPVLVQDLQCASIAFNTGFQKGQPKIELFRWPFSPLVLADNEHPIVKNLDYVKFDFVSTIDTIASARGIKKTILLKTSKYTKTQPSPVRIALAMATLPPRESQYINAYQPVACLLEGEFSSFVEYRLPSSLLSDTLFKYRDKGVKTKMIVVADGDVASNGVLRSTGELMPLGYDRYTRQTFANKTFLVNCVNYLLDDESMLQLRSREVKLRLLDVKKINQQRSKWQIINVVMPLALIVAFALLQFWLRKKRYSAA